ncbi:MAG TPA: DUF1259 domain-containing protein [Gemmatimonadales bacterium]|nr:DUF1259 domain-containing protein [Gemmatimonadales bacterium]
MPPATRIWIIASALGAVALRPAAGQAQAAGGGAEWAGVDKALGRPGKAQPGGVQKYSFPRTDLQIRVDGVALKPALALGSWVAFRRMGTSDGAAMAMGDLVLTEAELPAVVESLQAGGVQQTALHNHLQRELPRVVYLHIEGRGDPVKLATAIHAALIATKTPAEAPGMVQGGPPFSLDTAALARALGRSGTVSGGVYQVSVPRADPIRAEGMEVPPAMGVATAINFQPTGDGKAAVTGDFVLTANEVSPVFRTLEREGIAVTALHSHMLTEEPRLFFMHFWANDDALRLARGLRAALAKMRVQSAGA